MEDLFILLAFVVVGLSAGFLAGLFGIGGGTILVPVFLTVFPILGMDHPQMIHVAISTSLALIIPTAIASSYTHYQLGHLDDVMMKKWLPGLITGVLFGAFIIHYIPTSALKIFFAVYLFFCFIYAMVKSEASAHNEQGPSTLISSIASFIVGGMSTLLGTGGGTFTVPILVYFDYPLKKAIGVSAVSGFFIGIFGTVAIMLGSYSVPNLPKYCIGYVNMMAFVAVAPTAMLASPWGAHFGERLSKHQLTVSYTVFLLIAFLVMLYHIL